MTGLPPSPKLTGSGIFSDRWQTGHATLWCSAAIGLLAGEGFALYGLLAAVLVIAANTLLRPIVRAINLQPIEMIEEEQRYLITIDCRAARAPQISSPHLASWMPGSRPGKTRLDHPPRVRPRHALA
jgi:hypothetical protein